MSRCDGAYHVSRRVDVEVAVADAPGSSRTGETIDERTRTPVAATSARVGLPQLEPSDHGARNMHEIERDHRNSISVEAEQPVEPPGVPEGLTGMIKVTPDRISAGDTVYVDWSAHAPFSGFRFQLNGVEVPARGRHEYRPLDNTTYTLTATRARSTISLARHAVAVDRSGCTIQGKTASGPVIQAILQPGFYAVLNRSANVTFSRGLLTFVVWLHSQRDVSAEIEADTGLLKIVIPLRVGLGEAREGASEGSLTLTAWISLSVVGGKIYPVLARTQSDLSLPAVIWFAVFALGVEATVVIALLNSIAPDVLGSAVDAPLGPIASLFALFGDRVISATINTTEDPSGPFIDTIVCP
ncbi:hypothetical protein WMF30_39670 [Sorangium sp. So ce134]